MKLRTYDSMENTRPHMKVIAQQCIENLSKSIAAPYKSAVNKGILNTMLLHYSKRACAQALIVAHEFLIGEELDVVAQFEGEVLKTPLPMPTKAFAKDKDLQGPKPSLAQSSLDSTPKPPPSPKGPKGDNLCPLCWDAGG